MKNFSVSMALVDFIPVILFAVAAVILMRTLYNKMSKGAFALSFVCSLGMGYLSSKDFAEASMNWIAEGVNVIGQGTLLLGVVLLKKAGLEELELEGASK